MAKSKNRKNFTKGCVMDSVINVSASRQMLRAVNDHTDNVSAYIRALIMRDLKIDEFGKKNKTNGTN